MNRISKKLSLLSALAAITLISVQGANAGTATDTMAVSATVSNSCTISAGALAFGTYDTVSGSQVDGTATLSVACTKDAVAGVTLGQGSNADTGSSDAVPLRRMISGSDYLSYSLYQDSGRTTVWGNTVATEVAYTALSSASSNITVYGRIAASQDVPAGSYSDTVVATISF